MEYVFPPSLVVELREEIRFSPVDGVVLSEPEKLEATLPDCQAPELVVTVVCMFAADKGDDISLVGLDSDVESGFVGGGGGG
ncbi:MAG: hypothetical protein WCQ90_01635, partial [Deltaproteobacteria bacterium]